MARSRAATPPAAMTLVWGLFLASSWTWCIGMYLPVPLLRQYGWAGFVAFAVPNVLGCAAFGYFLTRERSARLFARHGTLVWAFSTVTIAYHCFFATFVATRLMPEASRAAPGTALLVAAALLACAFAISRAPTRWWPWLGAATYAASLACFALVGPEGLRGWGLFGDRPPANLPWLVPTLAFGFLLCPYLDVTFHRALQSSPSRHAFAVFGVAFAVMLVFTAAYAPWAARGLPAIVLAHLAVQGTITVAAHLAALRTWPSWLAVEGAPANPDTGPLDPSHAPIRALAWLGWLAAAIVGVAVADGEAAYLRFLVFYGLVFPACVALLCVRRAPATAATRWVLGAIILASLPLYELGFIDGRTWLLPWTALACVAAAIASGPPRPGKMRQPA